VKECEEIDFGESEESADAKGKTLAVFATPGHVKLAFETLNGHSKEDKRGLLQKKVYSKNGDYILIRYCVKVKSGEEGGEKAEVSPKKLSPKK
jgi:hypothetical protein